MSTGFGSSERARALETMGGAAVDLLVIGGGITGCGIARDAALRGLSVALVEREDFGAGTSSRSSKIIHGGIRYLAYGWLRTVRESARERAVLRRIAPHLVHPMPFVYPLYADQSRLKYSVGFRVFDWLAGVRGRDRHHRLDREEVLERVPGLRPELTGGVTYGEYITDDARLTLENALSAAQHGALLANHAESVGFLHRDDAVRGARVVDRLGGGTLEVEARVVVNATGAWAARTLENGGFGSAKRVLPSKGIHLLFEQERLPIASATHVRASTGREGLAMRRGDFVYVGTTDVAYEGPLDRPRADEEAAEELFGMAADAFPGLGLSRSDVRGSWAGVRPLIAEPGRSPRDLPRRDEIWRSAPGLLTIAGGKLTTYRRMAARVMERVAAELGRDLPGAERSREVPLPWAPRVDAAHDDPAPRVAALVEAGVGAEAAERIGWLYGDAAAVLIGYCEEDSDWARPLAPGSPAIRAEVRLAAEREMALTLTDALDRRLGLLLFTADHGRSAAPEAAAIMSELLGWNGAREEEELSEYLTLVGEHGSPW